jgi:hypothetical protein
MSVISMPASMVDGPSSLDDDDAVFVRAVASGLVGDWSVASELDDTGRFYFVLMPEGDDAEGPAFHVQRGIEGVELGACRWDIFVSLGTYTTLRQALDEMVAFLASERIADQCVIGDSLD